MHISYENYLIAELNTIYKNKDHNLNYEYLDYLVDRLLDLSSISRNMGIDELWQASQNLLNDTTLQTEIMQYQGELINLIIEGTDGELVECYAVTKYISNGWCRINENNSSMDLSNKLAAIIIIYAVRYIQDGCSPQLIETMLSALIGRLIIK